MDNKEALKKDIETVVSEILSSKEEAEIRQKTEEALQKSADTITELTTTLEERDSEFAELQEKVNETEAKVQELTEQLEAANQKVEETEKALADKENELVEIQKDRAAELRMAELKKAGVARSDSEAQTAKVKEMEDEEFAAYKDELVNLRKAVEEELAKAREKDEKAESEEKEEAEEEKEEEASEENEEEASEEDEETTPVKIDPSYAAMASMNLEVAVSDEVSKKYRELGKALAERMKTRE